MQFHVIPAFSYDPTGFEAGLCTKKGIDLGYLFDSITFNVVADPATSDQKVPAPVEVASIRFQNGPIQESGMNGIQVPDLISVCVARLELVSKFGANGKPDMETQQAINKLKEANMWLEERTRRRQSEGTEGRQAFTQSDEG
jgi:hypothetical protein